MTEPRNSAETPDVIDEDAAPEAAVEVTAEPAELAKADAEEAPAPLRKPAAPRREEMRDAAAAPAPRRTAEATAMTKPAVASAGAHTAASAAAKPAPSFVLSATGEQLTREELLARYRRQRALPEDPFETGTRPTPPPGYRDRIMNEPRPAARFIERPAAENRPAVAAARPARSFTLGQTFAIAAAMALMAGGGAGVLSARFSAPSTPGATASPPVAAASAAGDTAAAPVPPPQLQLAAAEPSNITTIDKKPVPTATLQVADVAGETNSLIPLALHAEPAGLGQDILLKISGIPEGAYLTSGHRGDDQIWSLSLAETRNVKLVVPQAQEPQIDLAVAAFEPGTGELAAPVKTMTVALSDVVVQPTSAPPPDQAAATQKTALPDADAASLPAAVPPPQSIKLALASPETPETQHMILEGDSLFKSGDVRAARKTYERAWGNDGSAAAAFGIARSYDPLVLAALALKNAKPDKGQAIQWYQRAASAGNPDAAEAIVRLQLKP